jgi:hypothetical protein
MNYDGVSLHTKVKGGTISLMFRDPFDGGQQKKRTSKTKEWEKAEKIAVQVAEAIKAEQPDYIGENYDDIVYEILEVERHDAIRKKARAALAPKKVGIQLKREQVIGVSGENVSLAIEPFGSREGRSREDAVLTISASPDAVKALEDALQRLERMRQQRDYWRSKAIAAETKLGRKLRDAELNSGPRSLREAATDFMKKLSVGRTTKQQVGYWVERFLKDKGETKDVAEVSSDALIEHLEKYRDRKKLGDIYTYLSKFLVSATHGEFDRAPVLEWFRPLGKRKKAEKRAKQWFWLSRKQALALIEKLREQHGDYFADAAMIQYGCGFRPEELVLLQTSAVTVTSKKAARISVVALPGYGLKNERSQDAVNVPSWAMDALQRRLKAAKGKPILFPQSESGCTVWPYALKTMTEEQRARDLWPDAFSHFWSEMYTPRLRQAATAAGVDATQVDGKTMRHTCGREIILKYGFEKAAAVLRHDVKTLREHYADLRTSDVSTER